MKRIIENAKKGQKTSILGIVFLLSGLTYLFLPMLLQANHPQFDYEVDNWILAGMIIGGVGLILVPDTIISGLTKVVNKKTSVILLLLLPSIVGCVSYKKCQDKFGQLAYDSIYVTKIDTIVQEIKTIVPGDSLFTSIQLDSLLSAKTEDTVELVSDNGRARVQFWKDKYNNFLNARFSVPPDTIIKPVEVIVEVEVPCPPPVKFEDREKWYEKYLNYIVLIIASAIAIALILKFR